MALRQQLDDDLKSALLARDSLRVDTIRGLKSAVLYADVAAKKRESGGVSDEEVLSIFAKEAKKRQESADLYEKGGAPEKAQKELTEKAIIEGYLPKQLSDDELKVIVDRIVSEQCAEGLQALGKVIGLVKAEVGTSVDGSRVAACAKERLNA